MSYSIDKWDSVVNKYNKLSPILYFKADIDFLEACRRNSNFLQVKIIDTGSSYDNYKYIFATVDKSPIGEYYCMTLEVPFESIPDKTGRFEINKGVYDPPKIMLSATDGEEVSPSPDLSKENEEAYNKIMNAIKVVTVITVLASAAAVSMGSGAAVATPATTTTTAAKSGSKLPVAGVGFSARATKSSGGGQPVPMNNSVFEKTKEIFISVMIFLGIGFIISTVFGVKPNLNFAV